MIYILIGFAALTMAQNWLPALITAGAGLWAANKSNKAQKQAMQAQQAQEAYRQDLAQQQTSLADRLLHGQGYVPGQGVDARPGQGGAMEQAQQWTDDYLGWLKNSPDITYNAQRGAMEGNIRDSMAMAARAMGQRGLSTGNVQSGAALQTMGGLGMARAGLLASLEAGRHDRMGERKAMGTQLTQGLMDRALNLRSAATGTAMNQQTQIPGMMMGQAQGFANQASAFGGLTGTLLDYYSQSRRPSVQIPTTVPMQGGAPMTVPNQFADFRLQPQGFGNVPGRY
jgi:hypothetical protein